MQNLIPIAVGALLGEVLQRSLPLEQWSEALGVSPLEVDLS